MGSGSQNSVIAPAPTAAKSIIGHPQSQTSGPALTLTVLVGVFAANFMDRQILAVLVEPIKGDLGLSDTQMGLLYGLAFAALYATAGIPIARYSDRHNRARIINASLVIFSLMTAVCGLATSYWQLLAARIGVAIGEGGTNPPSHSMISDLYPIGQRSTAMAIFSLGPHIGLVFGFLIGGWAAQLWGWRSAFFIAGAGGLLLATVSFKLLREPERGRLCSATSPAPVPAREAMRTLWAVASLRHLVIGAVIFSIAVHALIAWLPSFLVRNHAMSIAEAGTILALYLGLVGAAVTLAGGILADYLGAGDATWRLRVIAIVLLAMGPAWALVFLIDHTALMLALLILPSASLGFYLGPTFAMVQSLVDPAMRATAAAFLLFLGNVVGLGLGPLAVGMLSEAIDPAFGPNSISLALLVVTPLCLWAAYHYHMAGRTVADDLERSNHE